MAIEIGSWEVGLVTVIVATILGLLILYRVYFMLKERIKSIVLILVFLVLFLGLL